jgi:5S rRNA maturation endonuclease (ribonuclease M5)
MTDGRDHLVDLKAAADPGQVAAGLGLRKRGTRFFCPCQSAEAKTPDLVVGVKGFICHKCGEKGDLLKLIQFAAGLDFPAAVAWLESLTGIRPAARPRGGYRDKGKVGIVAPASSWKADPGAGGVKRAEAAVGPDPAVYDAFLTACRPVEGPALAWLKAKVPDLTDALVEGLRLRFCGREYLAVMDGLKKTFGDAALVKAGLLKRSKTGRLVPSFWHYFTRKAGFLVIPYLVEGRPVYLKVRPPVSKEDAERLKLIRFLNTAAAVPVLYNADALVAQPPADKVLICEGESDTWAALSAGFAAVGSPGARSFKEAWVESFRAFVDVDGRSRVILALDVDKAGTEGARIIAGLFRKAGLPVPLKLAIPAGKDLSEYMKGGATCK